MALYECTFIARQDTSVPDVHKLSDRIMEILSNLGAKLKKKEYWGLRSIAYEMAKNSKGHYVMLGIEGSPEVVNEFIRNCKISADIIKCLAVRTDRITDEASPMMQAPSKAMPGVNVADESL